MDCGTYLCHEVLQELSYFLVRTVGHEIGKVFNPVFIDVEEHPLEKIMVTAGAGIPFRPDFLPVALYGGESHKTVGSVVNEYEISRNIFLCETFASQQIPEEPMVWLCYIHTLRCHKIFNTVHLHKFTV